MDNENYIKPIAHQTPVIEVEKLYKSFSGNKVLDGVNLKLFEKENLVILGQSGTGKSVLIKCIVGLIKPDAGKIIVLEKDLDLLSKKELDELRRKIGFSFQGSALYDSMTVQENLEFALRRNLKIHNRKKLLAMVEEALDDVGLSGSINKMPSELSGGMKKRIGIARTLILKPEILLYDEPTSGLDPSTSDEINNLILDVQKKYGTSSLIITHDLTCAHTTGNRIIYLKDGKCKREGTFEELRENPEDHDLATFFQYYKQ